MPPTQAETQNIKNQKIMELSTITSMLTQEERNNEELTKNPDLKEGDIIIMKELRLQKVKFETEKINKL